MICERGSWFIGGFWRTATWMNSRLPVRIAAEQEVWVRVHMNNSGYSAAGFKGSVANGFVAAEITKGFGAELKEVEPLPGYCAFWWFLLRNKWMQKWQAPFQIIKLVQLKMLRDWFNPVCIYDYLAACDYVYPCIFEYALFRF